MATNICSWQVAILGRASKPQRHTASCAAGSGDLLVHGHEIEGGLLLVGRLPRVPEKTIGKWWFNGILFFFSFFGIYPLVMST